PDPDVLLGRQVDACNTRHNAISNWFGNRVLTTRWKGSLNSESKYHLGLWLYGSGAPSMTERCHGMGSVPMLRRRTRTDRKSGVKPPSRTPRATLARGRVRIHPRARHRTGRPDGPRCVSRGPEKSLAPKARAE